MISNQITYYKQLDKEIALIFKTSVASKTIAAKHLEPTFSNFLSNKLMIIELIRKGVPYSLFNLIQHQTPFTENDWAAFLDVSTKSLQRYKQEQGFHFKPLHSEKIIEMAEVTNIGLDVFGTTEKFNLWLHTPNYALGNTQPFELLKDSYGKEMVIAELTRINYGILA